MPDDRGRMSRAEVSAQIAADWAEHDARCFENFDLNVERQFRPVYEDMISECLVDIAQELDGRLFAGVDLVPLRKLAKRLRDTLDEIIHLTSSEHGEYP